MLGAHKKKAGLPPAFQVFASQARLSSSLAAGDND